MIINPTIITQQVKPLLMLLIKVIIEIAIFVAPYDTIT